MLPTLLYNNSRPDHDRDEGDLANLAGKWSESSETLNEFELDLPALPSEPRPHRDDLVFPTLSSTPQDRMLLTFECDKRQRSTRLISNGQVMYSYASIYENPSSKAGLYTQLRDRNGKVGISYSGETTWSLR
jgi:hypothetical protein